MDPFIDSLYQERNRLQAEIAPRQQRIKLIDELLASYAATSTSPAAEQSRPRAKTSNGHARPESKAAKVRRMTADLLTREGRVHRSIILEDLKSAGVMGSEKDPMGQLAAYLSANNDLFAADGNGHFTLREAE